MEKGWFDTAKEGFSKIISGDAMKGKEDKEEK
jgi:hypothetical protein